MQLPKWYVEADSRKRFNYLIRLAALHATDKGELGALAAEIGVTQSTICLWKQYGKVPSVKTAMTIQDKVGRDILTWESLVNPGSEIKQQ